LGGRGGDLGQTGCPGGFCPKTWARTYADGQAVGIGPFNFLIGHTPTARPSA